ncbi:MAG: multiheme c-type cytochrome, partial [Planctomycetota bacterium]|nr:multiheme c-type cytochrome [Planctomycetota bacterium]
MLRAATTALAGIVAASTFGCRGDDVASAVAPGYVGSARCATCHAGEHARWQGSHHDLAMQEVTAATILGAFDAEPFEHGGVTTSFRRDGDRHFVTTDGVDGTAQEFEIRYAFGVEPLQQYLVDIGGGRLQALQVAWDSRPEADGGQRWFHLYPDAHAPAGDPMHWTGPAMNWNFMCASCHSTDVRRGYDLESDSYQTTWSEIDVGCEACHGPGSSHVQQAEAQRFDDALGLPAHLEGPSAWILGPGEKIARRQTPLEGHAEVETCAPCHARRAQVTEEPWPGSPLLDHFQPSLLEDGLYHADGQILDEVYVYGSFAQSRMHAAGVTCTDCHDPHSLGLRAEGNALCARCHQPAAYDTPEHHHHEPGTDGASCVACHMPEKTYMVVDPRRDHSMRVPRPDLTAAIGTPNACQTCHADRGARWAANAVESWLGRAPAESHATRVARTIHAARSGRPEATRALEALAADPEVSNIARATAVALIDGAPGGTSDA